MYKYILYFRTPVINVIHSSLHLHLNSHASYSQSPSNIAKPTHSFPRYPQPNPPSYRNLSIFRGNPRLITIQQMQTYHLLHPQPQLPLNIHLPRKHELYNIDIQPAFSHTIIQYTPLSTHHSSLITQYARKQPSSYTHPTPSLYSSILNSYRLRRS